MTDEHIPRGRLRRLGKVLGMTTRVGADLVASRAKRLLGDDADARLEPARKILETLGELKGAALKVGQTLALVSDQLPPEARQIVARLFSQAPTLPYEQIAQVIQEDLGAPPEALFAEFSPTPFAGASLGQVHGARLKTGEDVAVKVQYPGITRALVEDLKNGEAVIRALGLGGRLLDGREYFDELRREIILELDYRRELALLEDFRSYLARWPDLVVPRAYPALCTGRVLVLERLEGPTLHEYAKTIDTVPPHQRFTVGEQVARAILGPFAYHRVIHGDAHPGNFVVMSGERLGVLDFGSVKRLSEPFWRAYFDGFGAALQGQWVHFPSLLTRGGFRIDLPDAKACEVMDAIARAVGHPLWGPYDWGTDTMVRELVGMKRRYALDLLHVRVPAEGLLFYRALAGMGHNLRALKASGDFRPFLRQALADVEPTLAPSG